MSKFKIGDAIKSSYGFGIIHDVSVDGSKYLIDDDTDFSWVKEEEIKLIDRKE